MNKFEAFLAMARSMCRDLGYPIEVGYVAALREVDFVLHANMVYKYDDGCPNADELPEFLIQVFRYWKKEEA